MCAAPGKAAVVGLPKPFGTQTWQSSVPGVGRGAMGLNVSRLRFSLALCWSLLSVPPFLPFGMACLLCAFVPWKYEI
jgi:hypothetical protein